MRLLKLNDDDSFSLVRFAKHEIPPYAILSHTWGKEEDEITFNDLTNGTGNKKEGFQKLRFCGNLAKADDLHYFWVDTCCIDKSNNNELSMAINSMFRWYQNAAKCYVYLQDVSLLGQSANWQSAFRKSRWFTRGWTLQELLAPSAVEFYSRDLVPIGDKKTLEREIHSVTEIAIEALQGHDLSKFSISERLKWGEHRETTEEEDKAYCLLGIFSVTMPLVYGEGHLKARRRLLKEIEESEQNSILLPGKFFVL
jgi:hypothetical protein